MISQLSEFVCPYESLDVLTVPKFRKELDMIIAEKPLVLLVNLKNVNQMDSRGFGSLITSLRKVREVGGEMAICSISAQVEELFELTSARKIFKIVPANS